MVFTLLTCTQFEFGNVDLANPKIVDKNLEVLGFSLGFINFDFASSVKPYPISLVLYLCAPWSWSQ